MNAKRRAGAEAFLSEDAQAILAYARARSGEPFTRAEIVDIAPGAEWDNLAQWPRTVAKLDPLRELMRGGYIELYDEQQAKTGRRGRWYKRWKLTGVDVPPTLDALLSQLIGAAEFRASADVEEIRAEILRRFDREGGR
jgi:hypothetical protein